jgi:hypothetical protein
MQGERLMSSRVSPDEEELHRRFIRGAVPLPTVTAAVDLVFRAREVREWLMANGCVAEGEERGRALVKVDFKRATDLVLEMVLARTFDSKFQPGHSGRAVLWLAASLGGVSQADPLRFFVEDLSAPDAKLCAEALMYAAGWMDGVADPSGGVPGDELGPRAQQFDDLLWT